MSDGHHGHVIEIWKAIVDVQRHFNEISMRIRGVFVTILLALFASIGFLLDKKLSLEFGSIRVQFATIVPVFGIFGTCLFYFIDRYWYHRLLVGAVNHAMQIEKKYKDELPELSLSEAIGIVSPYKPGHIVRCVANMLVRHEKYRETGLLHSDGKIELFYKSVMVALFLTTILISFSGGVSAIEQNERAKFAPASATPSAVSGPSSPVATLVSRMPRVGYRSAPDF